MMEFPYFLSIVCVTISCPLVELKNKIVIVIIKLQQLNLPGVPQKALPKTKKRSVFHQKLPSKNEILPKLQFLRDDLIDF